MRKHTLRPVPSETETFIFHVVGTLLKQEEKRFLLMPLI